MKILSYEADALKNDFAKELAAIRREYHHLAVSLLDDLRRENGLRVSTRIAVLSLFGMMNWICTWPDSRVDYEAASIAEEIADA